MIAFIALAALLIVLVLVWAIWPLMRSAPKDESDQELDATRAFLVRQERELDHDLNAGVLSIEDAAVLRDDIGRRVLRVAEGEGHPRPQSAIMRFSIVAILAASLPIGSVLVYLSTGSPSAILGVSGTPNQSDTASDGVAGGAHSKSDLERMVGELNERLKNNPKDLEGIVLLGRTYASLDRWSEARDSFARALALAPDEPALHAQLGEVITLEADGTVGDEAASEFGRAPDDPRSRYYLALREAQQGRTDQARDALQKLAADAPADASWRQLVLDRLKDLGGTAPGPSGPGDAIPASAEAPGPTAQDMQSAAAMNPSDREAMIRSMVARLAAKLQSNPDDSAGWERLARAYDVLGDSSRAEAARHHQVVVSDTEPSSQPKDVGGADKSMAASGRQDAEPGNWLSRAKALEAAGDEAGATEMLRQATEQLPTNLELLQAYADRLASGIKHERLPAQFVGVMRRINTIDPNQTDALWYLGLDAANNGDSHRAAIYWRRLAERLPIDGNERKMVARRINALP